MHETNIIPKNNRIINTSVLIHNPIQYLRFFSCVQYVKQLADVQEEDFFLRFIYANPPTRDITQEFHLRKVESVRRKFYEVDRTGG